MMLWLRPLLGQQASKLGLVAARHAKLWTFVPQRQTAPALQKAGKLPEGIRGTSHR